jgi:hypothetical protein
MGNKLLFISILFLAIKGMSQNEIDPSNNSNNQRFIVFVNGNRGAKVNKITTDNALHLKDPTGYWYNYDDTIISRFQPVEAIYFDGHHPVSTSMHRTNARFLKAYFFSRFCWFSRKSRWVLNAEFNEAGFQIRVENGKIAGQKLLDLLSERQLLDKKVTVDFVNHSMGYAYTLGILEVIKSHVKLGKFLAIAPESGGLQGTDWNAFEEVWQYGSNMDLPKGDVIYYQDGIAPQTPLKGLEYLNPAKGGRVFIPKEWSKFQKGFLKSHHLNWFQWFFLIKPTDRGYFKR